MLDVRWMCRVVTVSLLSGVLLTTLAHADTATRTSAFEYDPVSGLLTKEIIEPGNSDLCLVTEYTYDAYGNKISATTRNCNGSAGSNPGLNTEAASPAAGSTSIITSSTVTTTYDTKGRFPVSSTNALNQTETKVFDERFGVVTSLTGPNNLTTTWTYDGFGRVLTESRADNTSSQTTYALCDITCPANAKYKITGAQTGTPSATTYYDMYRRAVQVETQDKDGATIYSRTDYDHLGRTLRTSRPYKAGGTLAWTTMTYDVISRVLTTTMPDNSMTSMTYSGFLTVTTNALNQTRIEQINSQGKTTKITDTYGKVLNYQYDAFGNLTKTIDAAGNTATITYDARGRKIAMDDPDQGHWTYAYDALGQLKQQTDAKNQVVTFAYDKLGRITQRNEPDLISTWQYDTCDPGNPGKCIGKLVKETSDNGYSRTYFYDAYGRMAGEMDNLDGGYGVAKTFDAAGRVSLLQYPNGFIVKNVYSSNGYLTEVRNNATNALYWQANTTDAAGNVTQETYGNGIITNRTYNPNTGLLTQISAGSSGSVSNQSFVYDSVGNLTQRYDGATGLNESFGFDQLNRLIATTAQSSGNTTSVTVQYDDIGNIVSKSDIGTYSYGTVINGVLTKPHAVTNITMMDGVTNYATYTYDANGNNLTGWGRTITWNSWNMPTSITKSGKTYGFLYNSAHERVKQELPGAGGTTDIIYNISPRLDTGIHVEKRVKGSDGSIEYVHYLYAGNMPFGTVTTVGMGTILKTRYFHTDHLGSIIALTDEAGTVLERRSYDAWGKRRNLNGTPLTSLLTTPYERHGFTGHEELDEVGIVHMNGRMYDPAIGRFLSADPTIQYFEDMQNYNRYSYINNNPLSAVDYSGYGFFSSIFKGAKNLVKGVVKGISNALKNPVIRTAVSIYVGYQLGLGSWQMFDSAVANGAAGGFAAGLIQGRGDLKVAVQGAVTGAAFGQVGDWAKAGTWGKEMTAFAHGVTGGVTGAAFGGDFQSGFLAAGFAQYAGSQLPNMSFEGGLVARMAIGGTASVLGGGKFDNGAMTAAFAYMFNEWQHQRKTNELVQKALKDGTLTLNEANGIWRANDDANFVLTVDANKLTVVRTSPYSAKGTATAFVLGSEWFVHGSVTLQNRNGVVGILPETYDFLPHTSSSLKVTLRNYETFLGFVRASRAGIQVGEDFKIQFSGTPKILNWSSK